MIWAYLFTLRFVCFQNSDKNYGFKCFIPGHLLILGIYAELKSFCKVNCTSNALSILTELSFLNDFYEI
jgi:hypothetical protein